ncbi:MAG TPA: (2Fe-2S) ferredoxin domain-containing protein [Gammaproteobacteria bacterium]|nr:(2Fe-2S) ferredoxin domain-containing protein [Gammaproteobacteria bacterium]
MCFKYHVFFCCNQREANKTCCARFGAQKMRDYAKQRIKAMGLAGEDGVRINMAGCLGRCERGPVIVVYPQGIWYTWIDEEDIDEIIEQHLQQGQVVERLRIK